MTTYKEAWFSLRLGSNTLRASAYSHYDTEWGYGTRVDSLLKPLLKEIYKNKTESEALNLFFTISAYNLARNMRAFYPTRTARSWTSDIPDNYGPNLEIIDTDDTSIGPSNAEDESGKTHNFYSSWVGHPFWMLEGMLKKVTGNGLGNEFIKDVFMPTLLKGSQKPEGIFENFDFSKKSSHDLPWGKIFQELQAMGSVETKRSDNVQPTRWDEAMATSDNGGIDFTANKTPLEIQNGGQGIKFHLDPAMLAQLQNAPGFVPVIISVQPMTNLKQFLGVPSD